MVMTQHTVWAQCAEGIIAETCSCGTEEYDSGFCCQGIWFDPHYQGCPDRMFFVSTSGDDSNIGSLSEPWRTFGKASDTLIAGDAVIVRSGEYSEEGQEATFDPAIVPINSGTSGHPIIYKSYPGEIVNIVNDGQGPLIGAHNNSHIVIDGFVIFEGDSYINIDTYDTGAVTVGGSHYIVIKNCIVEGSYVPTGDNHDGIRVEGSDHVTLRNNIIRNVGGDSSNTSGIKLYYTTDSLFEHNEIYNTFTAIFPKGGDANDRNTFRYNNIHDSGIGFNILNPGALEWNNIYQNIVRDCSDLGANSSEGFRINPSGSYGKDTKHFNIYNNTVHNCTKGIIVYLASLDNSVEDLNFFNNIFSSVTSPLELEKNSSGILGNFTSNFNGFYDYASFRIDYSNVGDLSAWTSRTSQDLNSLTGIDPQFVDASNNDFHLLEGSLMRNAGRDIQDHDGDSNTSESIDIGAYITGNETIGLDPYGFPESVSTEDINGEDVIPDIPDSGNDQNAQTLNVGGGCGIVASREAAPDNSGIIIFILLFVLAYKARTS